ncbi:universal stress protein UspA [Halorubrum saccharovorum]|uniref:Universal stress protein UspA n=1 Tax=Halorubrum saccharovorum TaxID=2248 RepID=A0A0F8AW16_9EURY|nr:universal stress protein UspA [Halorubrum saccharovorum]
MSDNSESSPVRISVQSETSGSDEDSRLRSGPVIQTPDYLVVVPLTDALLDSYTGINVRRFLQTAISLAADNGGRVLLLGVETVSNDETLDTIHEHVRSEQPSDDNGTTAVDSIEERRTQIAEMVELAQELDPDVSITATVRVVTDVTSGVLTVTERDSETAILLLRGVGLEDGWILNRSTIDAILADAECNVFVENVGTHGGEFPLYIPDIEDHTIAPLADSEPSPIDSILLPVGAGPHAALATEAARAVAHAADAPVTVLHVISSEASDDERADGEDILKFAEYVLGSEVSTTTELQAADTTAAAIAEAATEHDFVSIGAPEQKSLLEQLVFQSLQETLSEQIEATILMAHDTDATMRSLYYRWKQGTESIDDNEQSE